jgi:nucleoside-diphosphate-sugar epimerase
MKSLVNATESINNNTNGTLNILWMVRKYCPDVHLIEIESLGTIQPDVNVDIPEGEFVFQYNGRESAPSLFPRRPGSFYHASKVFNTYLNDAAVRWWDLKITAINQGVVYGAYTPEIEETGIHSPMWVDECFGTVVHRFIVQALLKHPLTLYGGGWQKRGFLALNDSVQCVELFVDNPPEQPGLRIPNQMDEIYTIKEIATKVNSIIPNGEMIVMQSPRVENTHDFYYNPVNDTIKSLGFQQTRTIEQEIEYCVSKIDPKMLSRVKDLILPKITWH